MFTREVENAGALLAHFKSDEWDFLYPGHLMLPVVPGPLHWIPKDDWLMCTHAYAVNQRVLKPLVAYLEDCLARPEGILMAARCTSMPLTTTSYATTPRC